MSLNTISPQDLKNRRQSGQKCDLIDVRTPVEYRGVHVEFARNIPLDQLDPSRSWISAMVQPASRCI